MAFSFRDYTESDEVKRRREQAQQYETYNESQAVIDARNAYNAHTSNPVAAWTGGTYGEALRNAVDRIGNREKFTYDLNGDALYKQYKDRYINQGRMAMADTMGQAAALTGGYGNSYAATAGNQAYQSYLTQLNDIVPQLYQMALDQYNREGEEMYNQANLYGNMYNTEYGEYRDKVQDWNTEANRLADMYNTERNFDYNVFANNREFFNNAYNTERQWDYGQYSDAYDRGFANYQQGVSESQFAQQMALQQAELAEKIRANKANEAYRLAALAAQNSGRSSGGYSSGSGSSASSAPAKTAYQNTKAAAQNASQDSILAYIDQQRKSGVSDTAIVNELKRYGIDATKYLHTDQYNVRVVK